VNSDVLKLLRNPSNFIAMCAKTTLGAFQSTP